MVQRAGSTRPQLEVEIAEAVERAHDIFEAAISSL